MAGQGPSDVEANCDNPRKVFHMIVMLLQLVTYLTHGTTMLSPNTFQPQVIFGSKKSTLQVMLDALGGLLVEDDEGIAITAVMDPISLSVYAVQDTPPAKWNFEKVPTTQFATINNPHMDNYGPSFNTGIRVKHIQGVAAWSDIVNDPWMGINWR